MTSQVNTKVPFTGNATTQSLRDNFTTIANEITALQNTIATGTLNQLLQAIGALSGQGVVKITGPGSAIVLGSTSLGESVLTASGATAAQSALGLGSSATQPSSAFAAAGHTHTNPTDYVAMVGDSGTGGKQGAVPAPPAGAATKVLFGDGTWKGVQGTMGGTLTGGGNIVQQVQLKNYTETAPSLGNSGTTTQLSFASGTYPTVTLNANCTFSFTGLPASGQGASLILKLVQDGTGGRTASFPGVKWAGGSAPTVSSAANAVTILAFTVFGDGNTIYGNVAGLGYA
jgi:hypothetical protein